MSTDSDVTTNAARVWTCAHCGAEQTHEHHCEACQRARYATWEIQLCEHILEHIADGLSAPFDVLKAMQARPCYAKTRLELPLIVNRMRNLTKDETQLARQIAKARSARLMLEVIETGDSKDKIQVLRGIQVLGDVVEHKGEMVTKHVVELHEGPPPKREG